jgi:hypothetical protein
MLISADTLREIGHHIDEAQTTDNVQRKYHAVCAGVRLGIDKADIVALDADGALAYAEGKLQEHHHCNDTPEYYEFEDEGRTYHGWNCGVCGRLLHTG